MNIREQIQIVFWKAIERNYKLAFSKNEIPDFQFPV